MKLYSLYFSPTGGTKKVVDTICSVWDCERVEIDLSDLNYDFSKLVLEENDICIVAVPSFSGRVPQFIIPRLKQIDGKGRKAILVATFGNRAFDDTLIEMKDTLNASGFQSVAAIAAVTQHSVMPKYGNGRPDAEDFEELIEFAKKCKYIIGNAKDEADIPGNRPYREYLSIPIKPLVNSNCNECGLCRRKCPVQAISEENPKKIDKQKCISCLQCVTVCPKQARRISTVMQKVAQVKMKKICDGRKENQLFLAKSL